MPETVSSTDLVFEAPAAKAVEVRHSGDGWSESVAAVQRDGLWTLPVSQLGLKPGLHEFKFVVDGVWEEGHNRLLYLGSGGGLAPIPIFYLTWRHAPTTTMVVCWLNTDPAGPATVRWRAQGEAKWQETKGTSSPFPHLPATMHMVELTGLTPGTRYEFQAAPNLGTESFVTAPATLEKPLRFVEGGDVYGSEAMMDGMNQFAASLDPAFVILGGDLGYDNGRPELAGRWLRFLESLSGNLRAPDGRMIPILVALGNHEVRREDQHLIQPEDMPTTPDQRRDLAPYFFASFPFPADPGYNVLDFGNYLSLLALDTNHLNLVNGPQTDWLARTLDQRQHVTHLLPVYHVPAYPSARSYDGEVNDAIRRAWLPWFEKAGVRVAFEHHDHTFKVTPPLLAGKPDPDGIVFLGDGSWGVSPRVVHDPATTWYLQDAKSINGLNEVTLEPQRLVIRSLDFAGNQLNVLDRAVRSTAPASATP